MHVTAPILPVRSLRWLLGTSLVGLLGAGGCDAPSPAETRSKRLTAPRIEAPLRCEEQDCTQREHPLPNGLDQVLHWDPCGGQPFRYIVDGQLEAGRDFLRIGNRGFSGLFSERSASAQGPVRIELHTDNSTPSQGIFALHATCPSDEASQANQAIPAPPEEPQGPLSCTGTRCQSERPVPNSIDDRVNWDPCQGGPFRYAGQVSLERGYDYLIVDGVGYSGTNQGLSGLATGPIEVRLSTDYSTASMGIARLDATCVPKAAQLAEHPPAQDPPKASASFLRCEGERCNSPRSPIDNKVRVSASWDPCQGGAFNYRGKIHFEDSYDRLWIGLTSFRGRQEISGRARGAVIVRIQTDDSVKSPGIEFLHAQCEQEPPQGKKE